MSESRKLIKLRDKIAEALGYKPRPHNHVDAPFAIERVHGPVDRVAHDAMLRRIRLEDKS